MTKANMIKTYKQFSAADNYILGFVYEKMLYMVRVAEIMPRYLNVEGSGIIKFRRAST